MNTINETNNLIEIKPNRKNHISVSNSIKIYITKRKLKSNKERFFLRFFIGKNILKDSVLNEGDAVDISFCNKTHNLFIKKSMIKENGFLLYKLNKSRENTNSYVFKISCTKNRSFLIPFAEKYLNKKLVDLDYEYHEDGILITL